MNEEADLGVTDVASWGKPLLSTAGIVKYVAAIVGSGWKKKISEKKEMGHVGESDVKA